MEMIKLFTVLITLAAVSNGYADATFEDQKKRTLGFIEERLATITAHKVCVEKATSQEQIRECNKNQRMSAMKQKQSMQEESKK
jgi:hypothetical protein